MEYRDPKTIIHEAYPGSTKEQQNLRMVSTWVRAKLYTTSHCWRMSKEN